ncbi:unnamed protein product [Effrenium voratum]|uniref:RRM domain-containing protein n=1 Tax=Effrenium voratum TaxID=2562239 RepID=A0AA36I0X7_9DINO|nr:unnamed protein product [Effrenium voratum]
MAQKTPAAQLRGYKLLRLPMMPNSPITRTLLVKKNETRDPAEKEKAQRTLFVTHLDTFATEAQLQKAFAAFGPVERLGCWASRGLEIVFPLAKLQ